MIVVAVHCPGCGSNTALRTSFDARARRHWTACSYCRLAFQVQNDPPADAQAQARWQRDSRGVRPAFPWFA